MTAIVVLGMHRSGTSCLAGMLAAGGVAAAGDAVRNWDNARGHFEMLEVVRLNEAVLAYSGGHWLSAPRDVRWTDEHAAARDRVLAARVGGLPALVKDPRTLLVLPFWRAAQQPFRAIGIVRHPLAVARSLESWRETPLADGLALWTAHNRVLAEDHARHRYALVSFDAPKTAVVEAVSAFAPLADASAMADAFEEPLVHHDGLDAPHVPGLDEAVALYREMTGAATASRARFPRPEMAAFARLVGDGRFGDAVAHARSAIAAIADASAVLVPAITSLLRHRAHDEALALIAENAARLDTGLAELLRGKVLLAMGDARAVTHLEAACASPQPFYQARHLLPHALRGAGRGAEARTALEGVAREALYPHNPLATLAEWSWLDGDRERALAEMQRAIEAAPLHRRGRLRTRFAEWLLVLGDANAARTELEHAIAEDPGYTRSREILARL